MIRTIIKNREKLHAYCTEIDFEDNADKTKASRIAGDLINTLAEHKNGIGLAAPQIGENRRIFIFQRNGKNIVAINPEIVEKSKGRIGNNEQCLSCPGADKRIMRHMAITVKWYDTDGNFHKSKLKGLPAIIFQHELDHLNGILITDYQGV
jgi:peptide deformylase